MAKTRSQLKTKPGVAAASSSDVAESSKTCPAPHMLKYPARNDIWKYRENPVILDDDDRNEDSVAEAEAEEAKGQPKEKRHKGRQVMVAPKLELTTVQRSRRNSDSAKSPAVAATDMKDLIEFFNKVVTFKPDVATTVAPEAEAVDDGELGHFTTSYSLNGEPVNVRRSHRIEKIRKFE